MIEVVRPPMQNLEHIYEKYVEKDGRKGLDWTEVAVCIIQDGISNADESVLAASTVQGFFSPVVLQNEVLGTPVSLHVFEYTARSVVRHRPPAAVAHNDRWPQLGPQLGSAAYVRTLSIAGPLRTAGVCVQVQETRRH